MKKIKIEKIKNFTLFITPIIFVIGTVKSIIDLDYMTKIVNFYKIDAHFFKEINFIKEKNSFIGAICLLILAFSPIILKNIECGIKDNVKIEFEKIMGITNSIIFGMISLMFLTRATGIEINNTDINLVYVILQKLPSNLGIAVSFFMIIIAYFYYHGIFSYNQKSKNKGTYIISIIIIIFTQIIPVYYQIFSGPAGIKNYEIYTHKGEKRVLIPIKTFNDDFLLVKCKIVEEENTLIMNTGEREFYLHIKEDLSVPEKRYFKKVYVE